METSITHFHPLTGKDTISSLRFLLFCYYYYYLKHFSAEYFIFLIYLFLAVLGPRCCARAFSSCGEWGLLFVAVRGLLIAVASLVAEHGL